MEGPKEIFVPAHTYRTCTHCKYFTKEGYMGEADAIFKCAHPDKKVRGLGAGTLLWSRQQLQKIDFKVRIETPDWCPYLDTNNKRKVLVEKDMNCNKD
jgi:hypothetical protein